MFDDAELRLDKVEVKTDAGGLPKLFVNDTAEPFIAFTQWAHSVEDTTITKYPNSVLTDLT